MSDYIERPCRKCGSLIHHEDDCTHGDDSPPKWDREPPPQLPPRTPRKEQKR